MNTDAGGRLFQSVHMCIYIFERHLHSYLVFDMNGMRTVWFHGLMKNYVQ